MLQYIRFNKYKYYINKVCVISKMTRSDYNKSVYLIVEAGNGFVSKFKHFAVLELNRKKSNYESDYNV